MMLKEDCERIGVLECGVAFQKIGFMFREQPIEVNIKWSRKIRSK